MPIHVVRREFRYTPEQLFDLVLDVEQYPTFVPWWEAARVRDRADGHYRTDQIVRFKVIKQRFDSVTSYERPHRIDVSATGGLVKRFDLHWRFKTVEEVDCEVDLTVDLRLGSRHLQRVGEAISREAVQMFLAAFERRAEAMYHSNDATRSPGVSRST